MRGFSPSEINTLREARDTFERILGKKKTINSYALRDGIVGTINTLMRDKTPRLGYRSPDGIAKVESQLRRNEILKMRQEWKPSREIPMFRGRSLDGDPVSFFKSHYTRYIHKGGEVIFASDLVRIDARLLAALRNTIEASEMPIGTREDRTNAILEGRFVDKEDSVHRAKLTVQQRGKRARRKERQ